MAPISGVGTDPHIELSQAAQCGDFNTLDTILSFGKVEIRRPGPNGLSLVLLVVHGAGRSLKPGQHVQCAKRLIKAGAPLDEVDRSGRCALHWAIEYDKPELLELMLKAGASKTILDEELKEPLDIAVELSNMKCAGIILKSCSKEELDSPNEEGFTWMMRAAASGNTDICRELFNAGANPNIIEPKTGRTALHFAAEFDQAQSLITLLGCEGDPKIKDKDGRSVAHVAAEAEGIGCLHVLVEACTLLIMETTDDTGKTPLMLACRHENDQTVKALLSKNIHALTKDYNGQTALHWCAKNKAGKCARLLCRYKLELTKAKDSDSHTALHLACIAGSEEVVKSLLEFNSDTTTMDDEFHTPLHLATVSGNAGCIVLLAAAGADLNTTDAHGSYPIHYAANMAKDAEKLPEDAAPVTPAGDDKIANELLFIDPTLRARPREDAENALECLLALLENGASVVVRDNTGAQPLFTAAREGNESACRLLLDFEGDVGAKDNHGRTALHMAAQEGHPDVVELLLEQKNMAILDSQDDRGRTPLMYAAAAGQTACVNLLLEEGASPNHCDIKEISVAHCLASVGDVEGLKLLKARGGSLSKASKSGTFPLHEAALAGKNDAMEYLVGEGVPVNVVDGSGITPLHCSIANDNAASCKILLNSGAHVNPVMRTKDMRFLTPLDYALINVRPNCAEFLAAQNGLPGIIYTGIMANRIRLAWRRFRRRKYGRSRPETPQATPVPGNSRPLSRASSRRSMPTTPEHTIIESTTPLAPATPADQSPGNSRLPALAGHTAAPSEKVKPPEQQQQQQQLSRESHRSSGGTLVLSETQSESGASVSLGNLSVPNAAYILGNRLHENRGTFQNVMGSNPDLTLETTEYRAYGPVPALEGPRPTPPPPLSRDQVKTLNNFSDHRLLAPIPTTSFVPVAEGKSEPSVPYQQVPVTSTAASDRHEYQIESTVHGGQTRSTTGGTPYLGPASERSAKLRPISAGSGKSEGMCMEVPEVEDQTETSSTMYQYEIVVPETDPGNEEGATVTEDKDPETVGEVDASQFVDEACEEVVEREPEGGAAAAPHEDDLDEVCRPQATGEEDGELEDFCPEDGRTSVELEGEGEMELVDNSPETYEEFQSGEQRPAVGDEVDGELEELSRPTEEEDEEAFERGATPNSNTTEYLRDDISSTSLCRADSPGYIDARLCPEANALTLDSSMECDEECGEITLKEVIRDAFDTPYLRDYARSHTGETDEEDDGTVYEFCNESEDEISIAEQESEPEDYEGFAIIRPSSSKRSVDLSSGGSTSGGGGGGSGGGGTGMRRPTREGNGVRRKSHGGSGGKKRRGGSGRSRRSAVSGDEEEMENLQTVHGLRLRLEQELRRTQMEEEMTHVSRARVNQEVESMSRQSTLYRDELRASIQNTENMYRNVDQYIGQAMEVNNDLEDFLNQEARGMKTSGRGHRVTADNFKSYRQARTYNTSVVQEKDSDKMYFKRTIDKGVRSNSQTSLDGKDYLFTANRRLQTYEEWMMLKWQEMKEKSVHKVRWTPVSVEPPKNVDVTQPPPAKDVKILYREYSSKTGRINKVVATNPDGAKIEFRSDPPSDGEAKPARKKSPYKSRPRIIDPETAAAYKLPSYNFGGYNGQSSSYNRKPLHFEHPGTGQKGKKVLA